MSTRPEKASSSDGGNKKHRQAPYNKNAKPKAGPGGGGQGNASGVPGVSKIKSQIRQTTRLLSKVGLFARVVFTGRSLIFAFLRV